MEKHSEWELRQAMEELYLHGAVSILRARLYLWFNADRLSRNAYRAIVEAWEETCARFQHDEAPELELFEYSYCPMLNLRRVPFAGEAEKLTPLHDLTS
jgi:hypothetical protein